MADKVNVTLLRPLDGYAVGDVVQYDQADADRLASYGAVEIGGRRSNKAAAPLENASDNLEAMTKAQLVATAEGEGVTLESDDNKADIVSKIRAHRAG